MITEPLNRMYQSHLCSSLDLSYILLFLFSTYVLSFMKYPSDSSILDSDRFWTASWMLLPHLFWATWCYRASLAIFSFLTIRQYILFLPFLREKKTFPFLESFLQSLSFRIRNLNPAIPCLSLFSEHYLQLFSPRIRGRVSGDIFFIPHFFRHIWIFLHWF
jgi:hypothetical protein